MMEIMNSRNTVKQPDQSLDHAKMEITSKNEHDTSLGVVILCGTIQFDVESYGSNTRSKQN